MLRVLDDPTRKNIRQRFRDHHSAGEKVHASAAHGGITHRFIVQDEWRYFSHEIQSWQLAARRVHTAIINVGKFRAKAAYVDGKFGQQSLTAKLVEHRKHFLRLA